jgi:hypothetical protein
LSQEYFLSLVREIDQCATGDRVESIGGNQSTRAIFTLLPPVGTLKEDSTFDLVRELVFICVNGEWTAEG